MMETVFLGKFNAYTTKEAMAHIEGKDLNLIVLHLQRQPVVLTVEDFFSSVDDEEALSLVQIILNQAGSK